MKVEYFPKTERQTGDQRRSGHHRVPVTASPYRWVALSVFVLCSAINYLDRQTLATLAPLVRAEFHLSNAAIRTDPGGVLHRLRRLRAVRRHADRSHRAESRHQLWRWECGRAPGIATGFTRGLGGLLACRGVLGMSEAAGIPGAGKAIHRYLLPAERALGNALNQAGVSLGLILAPPVATWIAVRYGWRHAFVITGMPGAAVDSAVELTARKSAALAERGSPVAPAAGAAHRSDLLRSPSLWALVAANALNMSVYSLWTNWTTLYLVDKHHLSLVAGELVCVDSAAGRRRWAVSAAAGSRCAGCERACRPWPRARGFVWRARLLALPAVADPAAAHARLWTAAGISLSILAVSAVSVNMYTIPLDIFGGARAAFAISMLVASYGAVQAVISPAIGAVVDAHGYGPVCVVAAVCRWPLMPFFGGWTVRLTAA